MKKLLINGLLILIFIILIIAIVMGFSKLRAVDSSDAEVDSLLDGQEKAVADEKAVQEQTAVKVSVSNTSKTSSSSDADIDDFLSELG